MNEIRHSYSYPPLSASASSETQETARLRVVSKGCSYWELRFGFSRRYYLILSNGLGVVVTEAEYHEYNVNEEYDFTLTETTTVEQKVGLEK